MIALMMMMRSFAKARRMAKRSEATTTMDDDRERIRRELAATWPIDDDDEDDDDDDGRVKASALRAMAGNMRAVLRHCDTGLRDEGGADGACEDARAQVRSLMACAEKDVVVRVVDARVGGADADAADDDDDDDEAETARSAVARTTRVEGVRITDDDDDDDADDADVALCVVDGGGGASVSSRVREAVKRARAASTSRVVVVVEAADGTVVTRESIAAMVRVPTEHVFVTCGLFPGSRADVARVLAEPPKRSAVASASASASAQQSAPSPASAFALDDEDDDDDDDENVSTFDARLSRDEWAAYVAADAAKCRDEALRAVTMLTRGVVLRLAEKLALQYEPLRSALYARIRGERSSSKTVPIQRVAPPSAGVDEDVDASRRYSANVGAAVPLGIDVEKFRSVALQGVEQGATVATQVGEKVGSFLNWMVSEETDVERRRREDQERAWRERRKQLWEQERVARQQSTTQSNTSTPNDARNGAYVARHSPTASFVKTTAALVDMLDGSLGGNDDVPVAHQSKIAVAEARIRALESALRALDPNHELLSK